MQPNEQANDRLSVRADARSSDRAQSRRASFVWRDHESGELLEITLHGSEAFFSELEALGFERLEGLDPGGLACLTGRGDGVGSSATWNMFRAATGSTPFTFPRTIFLRSLGGIRALVGFHPERERA